MMCINEQVTIRKQRDVFRAEACMSRKHSNHAKLAGQFTRQFRREIPMQLNAANSSDVCGLPNVLGVPVNENADGISINRQRLDNLPSHFWLDVARALRIKIESDQLCAELNGCVRVSC